MSQAAALPPTSLVAVFELDKVSVLDITHHRVQLMLLSEE
jgi:hypothetical protein